MTMLLKTSVTEAGGGSEAVISIFSPTSESITAPVTVVIVSGGIECDDGWNTAIGGVVVDSPVVAVAVSCRQILEVHCI